MSYFVVDPNTGEKYGPADLSLLNQWAAQGRIVATTILEDMVTGSRTPARQLFGLQLPMTMPKPPPTLVSEVPNPYPRSYAQAPGLPPTAGQQDANQAWIWFAVGIACCGIIGYPMSIVCANRAESVGNSSAKVAKILSFVFLTLTALYVAFILISIALSR